MIDGSKVYTWRCRRGYTMGDLADLIGCTPSFLSLIERNQISVDDDLESALYEALGAEPTQLDKDRSSASLGEQFLQTFCNLTLEGQMRVLVYLGEVASNPYYCDGSPAPYLDYMSDLLDVTEKLRANRTKYGVNRFLVSGV